jgi:hypothetical protein
MPDCLSAMFEHLAHKIHMVLGWTVNHDSSERHEGFFVIHCAGILDEGDNPDKIADIVLLTCFIIILPAD